MLKRILSSVLLFPILAFIIVLGGLPLKIMTMVLALLAMYELYTAVSKKIKPIHIVSFIFALIYIYFADRLANSNILPFITITFTLASSVMLVLLSSRTTIIDVAVSFFGFYYIAILMSTIFLVRIFSPNGLLFVWLIFISAWGCDTGAYFIGINFGRHRLAPELSPKKSVEGAVGGVVTATLLGGIYCYIAARASHIDYNMALFGAICCFFGAIFGQFGDLVASAIKRFAGVKDYGKAIPGHGGIMDRFDSVLFTAPIVYLTLIAIFKLKG